MNFTFIRSLLTSFLVLLFCFVVAALVMLSALQEIAGQLQGLGSAPLLERVRTSQSLVLVICLGGVMAGLFGLIVSAHQAARIVNRIRLATRCLGDVVLDERTPHEFLGASDDLDRDLQEMILKIKASQQRYLDASPLTRLPGNLAIEQVLMDKMGRGEKFALCYIDLDDFKAYNDRYGYAKGSDLIKMTGEVVYRAKDQHAETGDFVGHIGGDDFVLITSPDKVDAVCRSVIADFDRTIPAYYHPDDRRKGYIEGLDRYGVMRRFPIMSISIAVVSDVIRSFDSPIEIARVATEIKDYVKVLPGSNYLVDRRATGRGDL